jgi:hypothetical protein
MKSKNIGYYTFDRKELGTQVVNSDSVNSDSESVEELEYDSDGSDYIPRIDSNDSSTVRQLIYVSMLYQISFLRTFNHFISSKPGFFFPKLYALQILLSTKFWNCIILI